MDKKTVCNVAAEAVPFAKVGGMADVVGALYKYLKRSHETILIIPFYRNIRENFKTEIIGQIDVGFTGHRHEKGLIVKCEDFPGVYFVAKDDYFDRASLYGEGVDDYRDNAERFSFFAKGALETAKFLGINADVFHCHDWHSALLPIYLKEYYRDAFPQAKTLFTIHNLAYQGLFPHEKFHLLGLTDNYFSMDELEFFGGINFMKAGIIHSDAMNTVSPTYAKEILTENFGHKLEGLLNRHRNKVEGIINGIDYMIWNPSFDRYIVKKYRSHRTKHLNKKALLEELGLEQEEQKPLFGMVTRLAEQKGIDYVLKILDDLLKRNCRIVVLGDGAPEYKETLLRYGRQYPGSVSVNFGFNEQLAHRIYAGCDFFLMPSKFEPCGLGQLISFKYGTVPIVRKVGGLADTVQNYDFETGNGTGIVFTGGSKELLQSLESAIRLFNDSGAMEKLSEKIMRIDFSWKESVKKYIETYNRIMST